MTTLLEQLDTDLADAFFPAVDATDGRAFTETLTYSGSTAPVIFDAPSTSGGAEKDGPRFWISDTELATLGCGTGDTVTIRTVDYVIAGVQPDGAGVSLVVLMENLD